jgi:hypothetical protein
MRRDGAVCPDCVKRPCLRRQCRRRQQGRQGAYVCARREDRQDRLGILPGSQSRGRRDPRTVRRDAAQHAQRIDLEKRTRHTITGGGTWTSYTLDPQSGLLYVPGGNPGPDYAIGVRGEGGNLYTDSLVVLDAKTGDYKHHFKIVPEDWHDWDVSNPPILIETKGGKQLLALAPKDGHLYGFDRATNGLLYRVPATRMENIDEPFVHGKDVHFCPGAAGGAEWNSPAYDPQTNLILVGEIDWCTSVNVQDPEQLRSVEVGQLWCGEAALNPFNAGAKLAAQTATGPDGFLRG